MKSLGDLGRAESLGARATGAAALLLFLALAVCTATANAAPLSMTFTESRANVGVQLSDAALFEAPDIAAFAAELDSESGSITAGHLQVPEFTTHITAPIDADVAVDFDIGIITGSFTAANGALTLQGEAGGTLTTEEHGCTVSTVPAVLALSTTGNSGGANPRSGVPFSAGLTGPGAIAGQWTDMQATPVDPEPGGDTVFCEDVEDRIGGPGGIWLKQKGDVLPPPAPKLTSTSPASPGASGTPRILGAAEPGATVRVYTGTDCAGAPVVTGSAAELGSPGLAVSVAEGSTAAFSATATDAAGNTSACSSSISYTRLQGDPPRPPRACVVPKVKGKSLRGAKIALRAAHCGVGKIHKPKHKKGKKLGPLVVKSSRPSAGKVLPTGSKVDLKLGSVYAKAHP
ncbi:MAG TPA: PASTA domain-containing protein [Solirubrobacterales bacterium]|nr:PASTA domain-containing protein [Solirubrobacterales bacterium]